MKDILHFEPITPAKYQTYIEVGTRAYNQHYKHLWPNENTTTYIGSSFTEEVLAKEEKDNNTILYIIHLSGKAVGIIKITLNCSLDSFAAKEALYLDKIYILNEYSGKGIGRKALQFVHLKAIELHKKIIWLGAMQKGPALQFYLKNGYDIYSESKVPFSVVIEEEKAMWVMVKKLMVDS